MSLIIQSEPELICSSQASDLDCGTWFVDSDEQIYVVVYDDRYEERRLICLGNYNRPFILNVDMQDCQIDRVLFKGTSFELTSCVHENGGRDHE